jgi:site-specific DNA-methyltransferase (adenine-specific)
VTLYHGDCRDVLPFLTRGADLLLTDPPYGVDWQSNRRTEAFARMAGDDGTLPAFGALALALRVLRPGRHAYCFGLAGWGPLPMSASADLVWDKELLGAGDLSIPWAPSHERILFGVYTPDKTRRARGDGALSARLRRGSVLRCQRLTQTAVTRHPTEKPVAILRVMIESSSLCGETVLDPFAGSGSTGIAAVMEGRRAVLIELEERYCEVAADRLRKMQPALALFAEVAA